MVPFRTLPFLLFWLPSSNAAFIPEVSRVEVAPEPLLQPKVEKQIYKPPVGARFQIILNRGDSGRRASSSIFKPDAEILDLDLFDTTAETIRKLHAQGKRVLCYFSAGSSESWRKDYSKLEAKDKGDTLRGWNRENWLDLRSANVWSIMQTRIALAAEKNCDGIDPDNVDAFGDEVRPGGGFNPPLTHQDSVDYIKKISAEAHTRGLAVGLKNAEMILPQVIHDVEFAVNEQCATYYGGCSSYSKFLTSGKPVFHIEYATPVASNGTGVAFRAESDALYGMPAQKLHRVYCLEEGLGNKRWLNADTGKKFSTVIKQMDLGSWVVYCDSAVASEKSSKPEKPEASASTGQPKNGSKPGRGDRNSARESSSAESAKPETPAATQAVGMLREIPKELVDLFRPKTGRPQESAASYEQGSTKVFKGWEDWIKPKPTRPKSPAADQADEAPRYPSLGTGTKVANVTSTRFN